MAWNPTEDEMKALISESVSIVREDREREHYGRLHEKYGQKQEDPEPEPGEGDPPPKKDPPAEPPKKPGLWFGNRTND